MSRVHTVNSLGVGAWGLSRNPDDVSAAIGDTVSAGWDTDCNGATVGGLWGLSGREIPTRWALGWNGLVATSLSGHALLHLNDLVDRTVDLSG